MCDYFYMVCYYEILIDFNLQLSESKTVILKKIFLNLIIGYILNDYSSSEFNKS